MGNTMLMVRTVVLKKVSSSVLLVIAEHRSGPFLISEQSTSSPSGTASSLPVVTPSKLVKQESGTIHFDVLDSALSGGTHQQKCCTSNVENTFEQRDEFLSHSSGLESSVHKNSHESDDDEEISFLEAAAGLILIGGFH